jgi:TetR/AcrR family transcriptional regulator, transcriptional repressor for nem operon
VPGEESPDVRTARAWLSSRQGKAVGRADAAAFLGLLAGTLQLARATPDRVESEAILEAGVRAAIRLAT